MKRALLLLLCLSVSAWAADGPPVVTPASTANSAIAPVLLTQENCATEFYPPSAIETGAEGTVILAVHVTAEGNVSGAEVLQSTGNGDLDQGALACVTRTWHFSPALLNGQPVAAVKKYAIHFVLQPSAAAAANPAATSQHPHAGKENCAAYYYPPEAIRKNEEGTVIVKVQIDENGDIAGVDVVQSSGYADLDEAARTCILQSWRFRPAMQNGKPVAVAKKYGITWSLR